MSDHSPKRLLNYLFQHVVTHSAGRTAGSAVAEQQPAKQEAAGTPAACSVLWGTITR